MGVDDVAALAPEAETGWKAEEDNKAYGKPLTQAEAVVLGYI